MSATLAVIKAPLGIPFHSSSTHYSFQKHRYNPLTKREKSGSKRGAGRCRKPGPQQRKSFRQITNRDRLRSSPPLRTRAEQNAKANARRLGALNIRGLVADQH